MKDQRGQSGQTKTFRSWGKNFLQFVLPGLVIAVVLPIEAGHSLGAWICFSALIVIALIAAARSARAGITVSEDGIVSRNLGLMPTLRFSWDEISEILGHNPNPGRYRSFVWIRLKNGDLIRAQGCGYYSRSKREQVAREIASMRPTGADAAAQLVDRYGRG